MGKKSKRREATKPATAVLNKCHQCGKTDAQTDLSICSGCRLICFCSKDCQTKSWPDHRKKCKAAKAEAEANISPIWEAARHGRNKELSKLLARYNASINLHCPGILGGSTALEIACAEGRPDGPDPPRCRGQRQHCRRDVRAAAHPSGRRERQYQDGANAARSWERGGNWGWDGAASPSLCGRAWETGNDPVFVR